MVNDKLEDLFKAIEESDEYKSYLKIGEVLEQDEEVMNLINDIKTLQKEAVKLEYNKDLRYKEVDEEIKKKVNILNEMPIYKEYLRRVNKFNDILSESSNNIEKYINSKI